MSDLLAHPPAPGTAVEVDAYFSGAGRTPADCCRSTPRGATNWGAILSDRPFLPELYVLGSVRSNALPDEAAWLVAAIEESVPGAPAWNQLPYRGRFRGRLAEPSDSEKRAIGGRVFLVEKVVRVYAQNPPVVQPGPGDYDTWQRYQPVGGDYSLPQPPGWQVEEVEGNAVVLRAPQWPESESPVTVRTHAGQTHHDPYDLSALPPLLVGRDWSVFTQSSALGQENAAGQGLVGYRTERADAPLARTVSVLFSGHGKTYELSLNYPLGFAAPQSVLAAYSAIVAGFRLGVAPGPTPTPPVRQALGAGPFLKEEQALRTACERLGGEVDWVVAQLQSEAEARWLAAQPIAFSGHYDGIWVLTMGTPRATRTQILRLYLDAVTGRELYAEEIEPDAAPTPTPALVRQPAGPAGERPPEVTDDSTRWIEIILSQQTLIAWEGSVPVRRMLISSGTALHPTVTGKFRIYYKVVSTPMRGPDYYLPGVPHTMYFYEGYALHGAYWHAAFGTPMSHGCINLSLRDAAWLFDWASPTLPAGAWGVNATPCNPGTLVVVR